MIMEQKRLSLLQPKAMCKTIHNMSSLSKYVTDFTTNSMAEQIQMYEPVNPGNTGESESLTSNPAYLTTSMLDHSAQQGDVGYELIRTPAPKLQQRQADS